MPQGRSMSMDQAGGLGIGKGSSGFRDLGFVGLVGFIGFLGF